MENLIKQRATIKGSITRIQTWFGAHQDETNSFQYEQRLEGLKQIFTSYNQIQQEIELIDEEQELDRDLIEDKYYSLSANLCTKINDLKNSSNSAQYSPIQQVLSTSSQVNKPQLNIPPFSGILIEWESFYQLFEVLIEKDSSLSNVEKLVYLRTYLIGEPLNLVANLKIIDSNFQVALNTLKERYANQLNIIYAHIKNILNLTPVTKCTAPTLRHFITSIKQNCEGLRNLQIDVDAWSLILVYILSEKLDTSTRRSFEFELKIGDRPTLQQFLKFLDSRCLVLERSVIPDLSAPKHNFKNSLVHLNHSQNNPQDDHARLSGNNYANSNEHYVQCLFCKNKGHKIYKCFKFINLSYTDKINFVKNQKLCFNCLASQHQIRDCRSQECYKCKQRHHSLLHVDSSPRQINSQENRTPRNQFNPETNQLLSNNNLSPQYRSKPRNEKDTPHPNRNCLRFNPQETSQMKNGIHNQSGPNSGDNNDHASFESRNHNVNHVLAPVGANAQTSYSPHTVPNTVCNTLSNGKEVLLATALIKLYSNKNKPVYARALLDSCSTISLITTALIEELGYVPKKGSIQISGIHGIATRSNEIVDISIYSNAKRNVNFKVTCCVIEKITSNVPQFNLERNSISIPENVVLADPDFYIPGTVDILLGADIYYSIVCGSPTRLKGNLLFIVNTHLGHIISGPIVTRNIVSTVNSQSSTGSQNSCFFLQDQGVDKLIENFWSIEHVSDLSKKALSPEEILAEELFLNSATTLDDGSIQVDLPLKSPKAHVELGNSLNQAVKRFGNLEKRFSKNPELFSEYKKFIDEYIQLGHGKYVPWSPKNQNEENKYFIPHHCVIKEESQTTKLRVVFDASMKTSSGQSLNDIMLKGYSVQPELYDILCRFRSFIYVMICDIEKMYRQIKINPQQTFLQNIVWRNNPREDMKCIELQTISYGTNSAPFLATRCLKYLADKYQNEYPLAAEVILNQCYVDDILFGSDTPESLFEIKSQLLKMFESAHFHLHKWSSNFPNFSENFSNQTFQGDYEVQPENSSGKVLGISWNPFDDVFLISLPKNCPNEPMTKRLVLSMIAQLFDPLGLIGPFIVLAKLIMQLIWVSKIEWDDLLPIGVLEKWTQFIEDIPNLGKLRVPRCLLSEKEFVKLEIHGFADASLRAYGACVYLRATYMSQRVSCNLISSKIRIAPLKTISLPRLELCAALLLSQLIERIISIFKGRFSFSSVNCWTDSQIALSWIHSIPCRFSIFVSNRISEIQQLTSEFNWRHIKSSENPADFLSRGMTAHDLENSSEWWHGPRFLLSPNLNLKDYESKVLLKELPEERKTVMILYNKSFLFWDTVFERFSSFIKLKRTIAFVQRFIQNCKNKNERKTGPLTIQELQFSECLIIKGIQQSNFSKELSDLHSQRIVSNKVLLQLSPFIDELGIIRVGGRLLRSEIQFDQKFPILLPSKNGIVSLMLKSEHVRMGHAGAQCVLSNFKLRYWPLGGLKSVKRIIRNCHVCYRFKAVIGQQIMADLPADRVSVSKPFSKVGLDFGGPLLIKSSKLRKSSVLKCYVAIFVCFVTKAVHVELVSELSTDAFILCLKRFISRRGNPIKIYSDNATNFVGACNYLKDLYTFFRDKNNTDKLLDFLSLREIEWKFIPPRSPHWGGIWEAAIKSCKYYLNRIVGNANLTFEELSTVLAQIEAILNSRPLTPISTDPQDLSCLTPGHFLIGESLSSFPEKNVLDIPENRLSRWQRLVQMQQHFWRRWSKEYLNVLQNKPKWLKPIKNLEINDMVLLKDENSKPLEWPLGRVIEIMPGSDGKIRCVKIRTNKGIFTRSIVKICPLPVNETD